MNLFQCCCTNDNTRGKDMEPVNALSVLAEDNDAPIFKDSPSGSSEGSTRSKSDEAISDDDMKEKLAAFDSLGGVFTITFQRSDPKSKLGVDVGRMVSGSLKIKYVDSRGELHRWNKENPSMALQVRDYIIAVNGQSGATLDLVKALCECRGAIVITVRRPMQE